MSGLGSGHLLWIIIFLAIVLVIFGPGKLPEVGSGLGKAIREFRRATSEVTDTVTTAVQHPAEPPTAAGPSPGTPAVPPSSPSAEGTKPAE